MRFSSFARRFTGETGIQLLMDDMARALSDPGAGEGIRAMLGGGNPGAIPGVSRVWRERMEEILAREGEFEAMIGNYDSPRGRTAFLDALAGLLHDEYGWDLDARNIAVVNGSQTAFFYLFNLLAGDHGPHGQRHILFPLVPEYIGYADQGIFPGDLKGLPARIAEHQGKRFKYTLDRQALEEALDNPRTRGDCAALCVSRPTNPTGNVLSDDEMAFLSELCGRQGISFMVDNAYGQPFPGVIYTDARPLWNPDTILSLSLSKLGLPGTRTGIVVARPEIIDGMARMNAILSLASGNVGQALALEGIRDRSILDLCRNTVLPWYRERCELLQACLDAELLSRDIDYRLHECEGAFFAWLWIREEGVDARALYRRLKDRGVLVVPGDYFFFGLPEGAESWGRDHGSRCIRITYARPEEELRLGARVIAEEIDALRREGRAGK